MRQLRMFLQVYQLRVFSTAIVDQSHPSPAKDSRRQLLALAMRASQAYSGQRHPPVHILLVRRTTLVDVKNSITGATRGVDRMLFLQGPTVLARRTNRCILLHSLPCHCMHPLHALSASREVNVR